MRQNLAFSTLATVWAVALLGGTAGAQAPGPKSDPGSRQPVERRDAGQGATPEATVPGRDEGWTGRGPRVGFVYPFGGSWAGVPHLTSLAYTYRYRTPTFDVESVPLLGVAWGGDLRRDGGTARAWTILDLYLTWTPERGDFAPYAGIGLGLRAVRLERDGHGGQLPGAGAESAMALCLGFGSGLALFRTCDFQIGLDLRFERIMNGFAAAGGGGAQGLALTFGLQHR